LVKIAKGIILFLFFLLEFEFFEELTVQLRYDKNSTMRFDKCAYSNLDNSNLELKTGSYLSFPLAV
jgi:hypothetical protein